MSDEMPSAKRIWELASRAVSIETAEWDWKSYFQSCDRVMEGLNTVETRMFKTMLPDYAEPGFRHKEQVSRELWTPDDMKWFMENRLRNVEGSEELKFALAAEGVSLEELRAEVKRADTFLDLPLLCRSVINEAEFAINMREPEMRTAQPGNDPGVPWHDRREYGGTFHELPDAHGMDTPSPKHNGRDNFTIAQELERDPDFEENWNLVLLC